MICEHAETWLLAARSSEEIPEELRRHVESCQRCGSLLKQLQSLDARVVRRLTFTQSKPSKSVIKALPEQRPTPGARQPRRPMRIPLGTAALAASLLLVVGWIAGRSMTTPRVVTVTKTITEPEKAPAPKLIRPSLASRLARISAKVSEEEDYAIQVGHFASMAGEVRQEAIYQAQRGNVDDLPRLQQLHERLLQAGVVRFTQRVPEKDRTKAIESIASELTSATREINTRIETLPQAIGVNLQPFRDQCKDYARIVVDVNAKPIEPKVITATPVDRLVTFTLQVAETEAPLARANASTELADTLAQMITVVASGGLNDDASDLGESLDGVMTYGVAVNLDRAAASTVKPASVDEVKLVREKTNSVTKVLEYTLTQASPEAREGMEKALAASEPGRDLAAGKNNAKPVTTGPPWKRTPGETPGKSGKVPPGWQKKQ